MHHFAKILSLSFFFILISLVTAKGQETSFIGTSNQDIAVVKGADTLELPFAIAREKRLSNEDIINKKENWYSTGLPEMTIDPIRGFSVGGNAFLFNNKDKDDPFYYYTPYRIRYGIGFRIAQNGRIAGELNVDIPYVFNTKWRLRGDIIYADDPNFQYFGIGEQTLNPLQYQNKITGDQVTGGSYNDYAHQLAISRPGSLSNFGEDPARTYTDLHYNEFDYNQFLVGLVAERSFFEGRMRLMFGLEYLHIGINHYDFQTVPNAIDPITGEERSARQGQSRITEDYRQQSIDPASSSWERHNIGGYHGGRIMLLQTGLMWDTRDLEPDPSSGFFAEYAQEVSYGWMGSEFDFTKHLLQGVFYEKLFPQHLGKTVLTGRLALGYVRGNNIPFTEVLDLWGSSEGGGIPVLGGARALRGYRESRFAGMVTTLANLEIRSRFHQTSIWNQHLAFYAVPFFDAGRVYDSFANFEMRNFKYNPGLGARIAWNQATILRLDYARSQEGSQFFFVFGHTF